MMKQGYNYHKQTKQPLRRLAAKTPHFNIFCVTWFDLFFLIRWISGFGEQNRNYVYFAGQTQNLISKLKRWYANMESDLGLYNHIIDHILSMLH